MTEVRPVTGELLLEFQSEEIPPAAMAQAVNTGRAALFGLLSEADLAEGVTIAAHAGLRRLLFVASGVLQWRGQKRIVRKGPAVGSGREKVAGFLRANGLSRVDQCTIGHKGKERFYQIIHERPACRALDLFDPLINKLAAAVVWPATMRFADETFRWIRPLTGVAAVFAGSVVPGALVVGGTRGALPYSNRTYGHRFTAFRPIAVSDFADYQQKLRKADVIISADERKTVIDQALAVFSSRHHLEVAAPPGLRDALADGNEYPQLLTGRIPDTGHHLPAAVISTVLRTHLKCISFHHKDTHKPAPFFACVTDRKQSGPKVLAHYRQVVKTRLDDAGFFWNKDREQKLATHCRKLNHVIFHNLLGTMGSRAGRIATLGGNLAQQIYHCPFAGISDFMNNPSRQWTGYAGAAEHAGALCKADLTTLMVGEFPELQGYIGGCYARGEGEDDAIVDALTYHARPRGPAEACPRQPVTVLVALADKLDFLVGLWLAGHKPTGSGDPYGLRRSALGIVRICLDNQLAFALQPVIVAIINTYVRQLPGLDVDPVVTAGQICRFFLERVNIFLVNKASRSLSLSLPLPAEAVRMTPQVTQQGLSILGYSYHAAAIASMSGSVTAGRLAEIAKRNRNILPEQRPAASSADMAAGLESACEATLRETLLEVEKHCAYPESFRLHGIADVQSAVTAIAGLQEPLAAFFDQVLVNDPDPIRQQSRQALLYRIQALFDRFGDFSLTHA